MSHHVQLGSIIIIEIMGRNAGDSIDDGLRLSRLTMMICRCNMPEIIGKALLHCPGIGRNTDDGEIVSVSAAYGSITTTYMLVGPVSGRKVSLLNSNSAI